MVTAAVSDRELGSHERWQTIELRHLAALAAVSHERSFRRAADRLGYVQSAISGQIAHLERAAGTRLVERSSGTPTVMLTDAGRMLLAHTEEIMARFEAAYADVATLAARSAETVRVGGLERLAPRRVARIVGSFRRRCPSGRILLGEDLSIQGGLDRLTAGALDVLVSDLPLTDATGFEQVVLERDTLVLLVNADTIQAHRGTAQASELAGMRLMIPAAYPLADELDHRLHSLGAERRCALHPGSVTTAQAFVAAGLGEAIVPSRLADPNEPRTVAIELPLALPECGSRLVLAADRPRSTAVETFIHATRVAIKAERAAADQGRDSDRRRLAGELSGDSGWPALARCS